MRVEWLYEARCEFRALLAYYQAAAGAAMDSISITGDTVQVQFSGVTLAQTARIVSTLESSPLVAGTTVTTASTTQEEGALVLATVHIKLQKEVAE